MFCYSIKASSLYFLFFVNEREGIDSWPNRAFPIEIYPAVASKCLKELKTHKI